MTEAHVLLLNKNISMKKIVIAIVVVVFIGVASYWTYQGKSKKEIGVRPGEINNFNDCADVGYPIMESYPQQCRIPDGKVFVQYIGNELEKMDIIRIDAPRPNQIISSPLVINGQARGTWFFEGDFPIVLMNWDGLIIAEGYASAKGEWMTQDFVAFEARLEFEKPTYKNNGALILQKDNPSGLPENDDALELPIFFE